MEYGMEFGMGDVACLPWVLPRVYFCQGDWIACQGYMYSWQMKWPSHNITSQLLELNSTASGNLWALWAYTLTVSKLGQT